MSRDRMPHGEFLQILEKLQEKKAEVEHELAQIPAAPSGRDVFQLCRGFERAFAYIIEVRPKLQHKERLADLRHTYFYGS